MRVDDSVVTALRGQPYLVRRARGYAPGQMKIPRAENQFWVQARSLRIRFAWQGTATPLSATSSETLKTRKRSMRLNRLFGHYEKLFRFHPQALACDLHPDYLATLRRRAARKKTCP
jgi:hydrogenase maturation protein HypF